MQASTNSKPQPSTEPALLHHLRADICVYGATSGGVVAAIAGARAGHSVVLVEPGRHVGGMTTGGLGWTDTKSKPSVGGIAIAFYNRIAEHYKTAGTPISDQRQGEGWSHEPMVAERILEEMLAAEGGRIRVVRESRIAKAEKRGGKIRSIVLDKATPDAIGAPAARPTQGNYLTIEAEMWIDASYEGDLMARVGVKSTNRRESARKFGELMAGVTYGHTENLDGTVRAKGTKAGMTPPVDPYVRPGKPDSGLLPLVEAGTVGEPGEEDGALQSYNFRLCLTDDPKNRVAITPPAGYDPARFELVARYIAAGVAGKPIVPPANLHNNAWFNLTISLLPNRKSDVNNGGYISTDFVGGNVGYPEGNWALRNKIWRAHHDYQRGLTYFLQNDGRVPVEMRRAASEWGFARDEFADTGGWPHQLYVRESRRMIGRHVMTEADCKNRVPCPDSIGMGNYSLDSHICRRVAVPNNTMNEGGFMHRIKGAYPIPYRAITPKGEECENLLVTFCLSSSHAAYSSLRMEPVLMILSESAALAASQCLKRKKPVQEVDITALQETLRAAGQVLTLPS